MSSKCQALAPLTLGKYPDILEQEAGLTPELSGRFGEEKSIFQLPGLEPQTVRGVA
jgi:hypothetical protein